MIDLIKFENGRVLELKSLPESVQENIKQHAVFDILKDEAKEGLKAARVDIQEHIETWLKSKSERTATAYRKAINDFFSWLSMSGIRHPLLVKASDADRYLEVLKTGYKNNSVRLKVSALASFYSRMRRYRHVLINPFHGTDLPSKEYKKAIHTDQNKTIPVMAEKEYIAIIQEIERLAKRPGKRQADINARESAKKLLPAVRVMAEYGLRIGALPTIERKEGQFLFTTKGGKSFRFDVKEYFPEGARPFKDYRPITIQLSFKRITERLKAADVIRYAYSCHDLRHFFAVRHYEKNRDIVRLKVLLGHASLNVTDVYLQSIGMNV